MKIAVIGAGAMGSIYAAHLSKNNEVYLVDINKEVVDKINKDGLKIEENSEVNLYHPKATINSNEIGKVDLIILFVKSVFSENALESNKNLIDENTIIMTLQNGAGHENILKKFVPEERIIIGTTEDNGAAKDIAYVKRGGEGNTNLGLISEKSKINLMDIKDIFEKSDFKVHIHKNIQQLIWNKIITNASLSVVTGILQCSIGFIARDEYAWEMTKGLFEEVIKTGEAQGLVFDREKELEKVKSVSINSPDGYTSIYQDLKAGRKTEVNMISGEIVRVGREKNVDVPLSRFVVNMVHSMENKGDNR